MPFLHHHIAFQNHTLSYIQVLSWAFLYALLTYSHGKPLWGVCVCEDFYFHYIDWDLENVKDLTTVTRLVRESYLSYSSFNPLILCFPLNCFSFSSCPGSCISNPSTTVSIFHFAQSEARQGTSHHRFPTWAQKLIILEIVFSKISSGIWGGPSSHYFKSCGIDAGDWQLL